MLPETKAKKYQHWELISWVFSGKSGIWKAISTAYTWDTVPIETFLPYSAEKVEDELKIRDLETYIFDHGKGENCGSTVGKCSSLNLGCSDHFEYIYKALIDGYDINFEKELKIKTDFETPFEIVTFVYKPTYNGWVTIATKGMEKFVTNLHPYANKAYPRSNEEVKDQETLYYDKNNHQKERVWLNGIKAIKGHFNLVVNEIDLNSGRDRKFLPYEARLDELINKLSLRG